ncbi:hemicentin-1-like [Actinia tenebrosa]|uniref:Hemicentin-1-like n=1 Tax=Actinia tenebrosa TaxID=6105 RepID=A0A6P8IR57_ACTTE|nr:hemicentin-1-like [Actinia tenebrosa]
MKYTIIGALLLEFLSLSHVKGCVNVRPLGVANRTMVPDIKMSSSSSFRESVDYLTAKHGRLYTSRAWCPASLGGDDWLQVDMGNYYNVCGVATQGKEYRTDEWATNYTLSISLDGVTWVEYNEDNRLKVFAGNIDGVSVVRQNVTSVWARYVRFYPRGYQLWPCLRVEIYVEFSPPIITIKPETQTIAVGNHLLLNCLSKGSPKPKVTWSLNGNDIIFGEVLLNGSLLVKSVENDKNFEGEYRCVATNKEGSASRNAVVIVHEKPKILNSLPSYSPYLRGKTAVLSCYGVGDPVPSITWTKDGSPHIPRGTIHADGHVLVISQISARDQGVYRCVLSNYLGFAMSATNLTILDRPTIDTVRTRKTIRAILYHTINIGCYGNSILPLTYTWTKNKVAVTDSDNHGNNMVRVFGNLLIITPNEPRDYGTYVCHVNNTVDTAMFEIEVVPFHHETNQSAGTFAALSNSPSSCEARLGIIISLVIVFLLSLALNLRLIYRYRQMKNASKASLKSISLGKKMNAEGSNLMKDTEIAWDNLIPAGHGGPFVNAGIERDTEPAIHYRKQVDDD